MNKTFYWVALCCGLGSAAAYAEFDDDAIEVGIAANGSTAPITLNGSDGVFLVVAVDAGMAAGQDVDGWLFARTPFGVFHFDPGLNTWTPGDAPSYQGPLFSLGDFEVFNMNGLPDGVYTVRFGVDPDLDGFRDARDFVFESAKVNISSTPVPEDIIAQNTVLDEFMNAVYFWNQELPALDVTRYASPEGLLAHLRFDQRDRFSAIVDPEPLNQFLIEGQFVGVGIGLQFDDSGDLRISMVYRDSPADRAALRRGDSIVSVNGVGIDELIANDAFDSAFGPREVGVRVTLGLETVEGVVREADLSKDLITIASVFQQEIFPSSPATGGKTVGYLVFTDFISPAFSELKPAFGLFNEQAVDELILDLRYNGGGFLDVARYLASLIKGSNGVEPFITLLHNQQLILNDFTYPFSSESGALNLRRLIVITTESTCSASEALINGLEPYIDVVLVGARTCGKPVGFNRTRALPGSDRIVRPITFELVNALGQGRYFSGISPDCAAADELTKQLGDPQEASLREALHVAAFGACSIAVAKTAPRRKRIVPAGFGGELAAF